MDYHRAYGQVNGVDSGLDNENDSQLTGGNVLRTVCNVSQPPIPGQEQESTDHESVGLMSSLNQNETLSNLSDTTEASPISRPISKAATEPRPKRVAFALRRDWGWWWEASGVAVSCCCIAAIVSILAHIDNKPLEYWTLPVKPNSLIAVFSTIAKSALLMPIAECISQLKWMHFHESRPLSHVQAFDDASRGPWGSILSIFRTRMSPLLSTAAAVLTVAMLAFEPTSQQIIEYYTRDAVLHNLTAYMAQPTAWSSKGFSDEAAYGEYLTVSGLVRSGVADHTSWRFQPHLECPTSDCQWPTFESLGICHSCNTTVASVLGDRSLNCTYNVTFAWRENSTVRKAETEMSSASLYEFINEYSVAEFLDLGDPRLDWSDPALRGGMNIYSPYDIECAYLPPSLVPPQNRFNVGFINFTTATGLSYPFSDTSLYSLTAIRPRRSVSRNVSDTTFMANVTADVTNCELKFCVKQYSNVSVHNSAISIGSVSSFNLTDSPDLGIWPPTHKEESIPGATAFYINPIHRVNMWKYLTDILQISQWTYNGGASLWQWVSSQISMADFLASSDLDEVMGGLAHSLTGIIQSEDNQNLTMVAGEAIGPKIFVKVNWQWLACPISIVLLATFLLVATSLKSSSAPLLLKSSPLGLLFHTLEGRTRDELDIAEKERPKDTRETAQSLYGRAKGMTARFERNENGDWAFVRVD